MIELPLEMPVLYTAGIAVAFIAIIIAFSAILREKDDIHKMIIIDLIEITGLVVIALIATDLAEALILPGLVVGVAEIMAVSELWLAKENLQRKHAAKKFDIEVLKTAPPIIGIMLAAYGIFLTGFSGGLIAALGLLVYFLGKNVDVPFAKIE
ncbi:MAG: EhaG family protein, partial [Methanocorpusculum sp.]|nr:EhaG family protein [Methanocorpusculum sp.]